MSAKRQSDLRSCGAQDCTPHSRPRKLHIARFRPTGENSLISLLVLFPREPLCWVRAGTLLTLSKRMRRARWKKKSRRGLWSKLHRPAKAGVGFAGGVIGVGSPSRAARIRWELLDTEPTDTLRLKGFQQPLAAAEWQLKEQ